MATKVGSLIADLGLNTAKFENGIKKSQSNIRDFSNNAKRHFNTINDSITGLAGNLLALAGVGSLGMLAQESLHLADEMQKLNAKTGVSTEALSELKFAGEQSGIEFATMTKAMEKMTNTAAEASQGIMTYSRAYESLGINVDQFMQLRPEDQLMVMADAFKQVDNATERTALAMDIFGQRGTQMLQMFDQGAAGINLLRGEARALGLTLTQDAAEGAAAADDAINRALSTMRGFALEATTNMAPSIEAMANNLSTLLPAAVDVGLESFYELRKHGLQMVSFIVQKVGQAQLFMAEILEKLGMSNTNTLEAAKFSAEFSAQLMKSAGEAAKMATLEQTAYNHAVSEIPQEEITSMIGAYKGLIGAGAEAKTGMEELGSSIRINIGDTSTSVFDQLRNSFKNAIFGMINDWITSGITDLFKNFGKSGGSGGGGLFGAIGGLLGFNNGGSFKVGGRGGTDSNLVAFRATKGETVSITPNHPVAGGGSGGSPIVFNNSYDFSGSTLSESEVRQMIEQSQRITKSQIQNEMVRGRF